MPHKCQDPETHFSWLALCLKERRVNAEKIRHFVEFLKNWTIWEMSSWPRCLSLRFFSCSLWTRPGFCVHTVPNVTSALSYGPGFCVHMVPIVTSAHLYGPGFCVHTVPTVTSARSYGPGFCVHTVPTVTSLLVRVHLWSCEEQQSSCLNFTCPRLVCGGAGTSLFILRKCPPSGLA